MIQPFNAIAHQDKMDKPVNKLIEQLDKLGIKYYYIPASKHENVAFAKGDKRIEISKHSFYRYSGMMQITRTKKDSQGNDTNWTEVFPVTDDDWLQKFIKPIILKLLEVA